MKALWLCFPFAIFGMFKIYDQFLYWTFIVLQQFLCFARYIMLCCAAWIIQDRGLISSTNLLLRRCISSIQTFGWIVIKGALTNKTAFHHEQAKYYLKTNQTWSIGELPHFFYLIPFLYVYITHNFQIDFRQKGWKGKAF